VTRHVVLLRGINLGSRNRIAMPELRTLLEDAGFDDVRTYVQSGNVVLRTRRSAATVAREVAQAIERTLGLEIAVLARTRDELAKVVERNPLRTVATDAKRYQVTFLERALPRAALRELEALAQGDEQVAAHGREIYAWHPKGVARSKLWARLASRDLGVAATSRNWTTVTKLLALADE
jgi:uncharacterized protein (DUF1697 family)